EILYAWLETELIARRSCVVESNFKPEWASPRLRALHGRYPFTAIQVQLHTDGPVLHARFQARATAAGRHPGHGDAGLLEELGPDLRRGHYDDLAIGGPVIHLDTTDFTHLDYPRLLATVQDLLHDPAPAGPGTAIPS
ncbi:MAG TPA: hypothetical protein VM536_03575, partial [Chloroflexia bacterium]|nr:hypothetical protein [Chloroflexia bacterium]